MENVSNVSSEEELLQLRNEGKISEDEYEELLETLRKTTSPDIGPDVPETNKAKSKRKLGIIAFVLMLAGIVLPVVCILLLSVVGWFLSLNLFFKIGLWLFPGVVLEIAALGIGIAAWADPFGKAAAIVSLLVLVAVFLFVLATMPHRVSVVRETQQATASKQIEATELKRFPLDNLDGIITRSGIRIDKQISSDGNGSLRIEATEPTTVRLFETGDIDIENARLIYRARLRTEDVEGKAYLEMWCHIAGLGDFFSRGLDRPLTGSTDWVTEETPFFLKAGQNPDNIKLNLVIKGKGTVWIDDIRLLKGPLKY
ncbi:hypothetical protein ES703_77177 [subsurface metagenome]